MVPRSRPRVGCLAAAVGLLAGAPGCVSVRTEPIRVEPVHITIDVRVRVVRELDDFFGDLDRAEQDYLAAAPSATSADANSEPSAP